MDTLTYNPYYNQQAQRVNPVNTVPTAQPNTVTPMVNQQSQSQFQTQQQPVQQAPVQTIPQTQVHTEQTSQQIQTESINRQNTMVETHTPVESNTINKYYKERLGDKLRKISDEYIRYSVEIEQLTGLLTNEALNGKREVIIVSAERKYPLLVQSGKLFGWADEQALQIHQLPNSNEYFGRVDLSISW